MNAGHIKRLDLSANQDTPSEEQIAHSGPSQHIDPMLADSEPDWTCHEQHFHLEKEAGH